MAESVRTKRICKEPVPIPLLRKPWTGWEEIAVTRLTSGGDLKGKVAEVSHSEVSEVSKSEVSEVSNSKVSEVSKQKLRSRPIAPSVVSDWS